MKKLLGIVVLSLLWCNVGLSDEIYLSCGQDNKKEKIYIVFNDKNGFEKYKIKNVYKQYNFESINISQYYVELKRSPRNWKINRYTGLGIVDVAGDTWEYNCERLDKIF
jgi:hypothetical protein